MSLLGEQASRSTGALSGGLTEGPNAAVESFLKNGSFRLLPPGGGQAAYGHSATFNPSPGE